MAAVLAAISPLSERTLSAVSSTTSSPTSPSSLPSPLFTCSPCGRRFHQAAAYRRHRDIAHSPTAERFHCAVCGNTFASPRTLTMHMVIHAAANTDQYYADSSSTSSSSSSHAHNRHNSQTVTTTAGHRSRPSSPISKKLKFSPTTSSFVTSAAVGNCNNNNNNNINNGARIVVNSPSIRCVTKKFQEFERVIPSTSYSSAPPSLTLTPAKPSDLTAIVKPNARVVLPNTRVVYVSELKPLVQPEIIEIKQEPLYIGYETAHHEPKRQTFVINAVDFGKRSILALTRCIYICIYYHLLILMINTYLTYESSVIFIKRVATSMKLK